MGLREKIQNMDITVLRIIAFSGVILSFLAALGLTYHVGRRLSKGHKRTYVLLELTKKKAPLVVSKGSAQLLKGSIGKTVTVEGEVSEIVTYPNSGTVGLKMGPLTVLILPDVVEELKGEGRSPEGWKGLNMDATGKVRFDPIYGLQMIIKHKKALEFIGKKRGEKGPS